MPFSDPIADGPIIQEANMIALTNGVTVSGVLDMVREARRRGLKIPVLLMGYYNPVLRYGEEKLLHDCKEAGVHGFVLVDLPIEEAARFRKFCVSYGFVQGHLSFRLCANDYQAFLHSPYCAIYVHPSHESPVQHSGFLHLCCFKNGCDRCLPVTKRQPS